MDWYKVGFPVDDLVNQEALQSAFKDIFMVSGSPHDAALFESRDWDSKEDIYYFSPRAAEIARIQLDTYGGVPCPPQDKSVTLLIGHADARERLL